MEEIEKQLFSIFGSFIRDLSKTYPEIKSCLYRNYEECLLNEDKSLSEYPKLQIFLDLIHEYEKYITDKNSEFFDLEIELLEEISFKRLWEKNISGKTRESIWKYLQTFQIININLHSNAQLREALSQIGTDTVMEVDRRTVKDLKKLKKLSGDIKQEVTEEETEFDELLGGLMDTGIGDIAKEVASGMNIEEMFGDMDENTNPMEMMSRLMNPEKMGSIFQNINKVMEQKMETGELTEDKLKNEAEGMMGKLSENPMFSDIMGQMNPDQTNSDVKQGDNCDDCDDCDDCDSTNEESCCDETSEPELTREEKQRRLREKIKEKKNNR